jgi:hypothetical protein
MRITLPAKTAHHQTSGTGAPAHGAVLVEIHRRLRTGFSGEEEEKSPKIASHEGTKARRKEAKNEKS